MSRPRKDLMVVQKPNGELAITEKRKYYQARPPKPQRAVTVIRPQVVIAPPSKPLTITYTRTTNVKDPPPEFFDGPSVGDFAILAFLNGLVKGFTRRD